MTTTTPALTIARSSATPLAVLMPAVLSALLPAGQLLAATHSVTSCSDDATAATTAGTLRYEVGHAATGDVLDLSTLTCSTITLQSGEIVVPQADLHIKASAAKPADVSANFTSRVFDHTGTGTLEIEYATVEQGRYVPSAATTPSLGGCIASQGTVYLRHAVVNRCLATLAPASTSYVRGGAVYAALGASVVSSSITNGYARTLSSPNAGGSYGGGIFVGKNGQHPQLMVKYSTIADNNVRTPTAGGKFPTQFGGGGIAVASGADPDKVLIEYSTINGNYAPFGGAVQTRSPVTIENSTISGNHAPSDGGAGGLQVPTLVISNSTIAFNSGAFGGMNTGSLDMQSSVVFNNSAALDPLGADVILTTSNPQITGGYNLIGSMGNTAPDGFIVSQSDPHLVPLSNHGGPTATHALPPYSVAVGTGNNPADYVYDQRGTGYPRPAPHADIGAYQRQAHDDELFYGDFSG